MAQYKLDAIGEVCPVPLMLVTRKMQELAPGDELMIRTDFSRAVRNILDWAARQGHEIVEVEEPEAGLWDISLRRR